KEDFQLCGPLHLTTVDWTDPRFRRSVAACLVQGVYILERDRQDKRVGTRALAARWWEAFGFDLYMKLIDEADSSTFGAIYHLAPSSGSDHAPRYVIAFRGTLTKGQAFTRDLELDIHVVKNGLHRTSRFEVAMQAVRHVVSSAYGGGDLWLTGHSLGAAMALLAGKTMAKDGIFLDAFLFNPPFLSAPIERIKDERVKHGIRFAGSVITAGLALALKNKSQSSFSGLSRWLPGLFVNPADHICSEYIGYFEHRRRMDGFGVGGIERLASQHSLGGLLLDVMGKKETEEEPFHLIPSAVLTVNRTPAQSFKEAHGIHQWWKPSHLLQLES
ncbi:hypothetical protein M569_06473, partial [Genlisea aurea]